LSMLLNVVVAADALEVIMLKAITTTMIREKERLVII
jgi:hypothetical protein